MTIVLTTMLKLCRVNLTTTSLSPNIYVSKLVPLSVSCCRYCGTDNNVSNANSVKCLSTDSLGSDVHMHKVGILIRLQKINGRHFIEI